LLQRAAGCIGPGAVAFESDHGLGVRSLIPPDNPVSAIVGLAVSGEQLDGWEWDIAADRIVREAGGCASDLAGDSLLFNQPDPRMKSLVLSTDPGTQDRLLTAIARSRG